MFRYTIIYDIGNSAEEKTQLGLEDKVRLKFPTLVTKTFVYPPYFFMLVETDQDIEKIIISMSQTLKDAGIELLQSGPGWWVPKHGTEETLKLSAYPDMNYSHTLPQVEHEVMFKYKKSFLLFQLIGSFIFLSGIVFFLSQNIVVRILFPLVLFIFLAYEYGISFTKVICTENEIIFFPMIGEPEHYQWSEIYCLKVVSLKGEPRGIIQSHSTIKEFTFAYANKDLMIKTILEKAELALSESTFNSMIYLRFNSKQNSILSI